MVQFEVGVDGKTRNSRAQTKKASLHILVKLSQDLLFVKNLKNYIHSKMEFSAINNIIAKSEYLPTKKLKELEVNEEYLISDVRIANTKWGKRYVAEIRNEFTIFLPPRVVKAFDQNPATFEKLLETAHYGQLYMKYLGGVLNAIEFCQRDV